MNSFLQEIVGWKVCNDCSQLNKATRKDHFRLPFIDQMLEKIDFYCFLMGILDTIRYQLPEDQDKTIFTFLQSMHAYRKISFGLCNTPATLQCCMSTISADMIHEILMENFTLFGKTFDDCLIHLTLILKRCEDTNLNLTWKNFHFLVKEGIVLGHKITVKGIEVDKA